MGKSLITRAALLGTLVASTLPAGAQDGTPAGLQMKLGLSQSLDFSDNYDLDATSRGNTALATTVLRFGLTSETATETLRFNAAATLRGVDGPDTSGFELDAGDPSVDLAYGRQSVASAFDFKARYREQDVEFLRPLDDFLNDDGEIELPEDLDDLNGTGIRTDYGVDVSLTLRRDTPLEFILSAGISGLQYRDTTNPDLVDNRRSSIGAKANLRLSAVTTARVGLGFSNFEEVDVADSRRDTATLDFGLTRVLVRGSATASLGFSDTEDGTRVNVSIGRTVELPNGALSFTFGLTQLEDGDPDPIATLDWRQNLPRGQIDAQLRRSVTSDNDDEQQLTTAVSLGYSQELNSLSNLGLRLNYSQSDAVIGSDDSSNTNFSATYSRLLTEDWAMDLGYRYQMRDDATDGRADSNSVFLNLRREFDLRR